MGGGGLGMDWVLQSHLNTVTNKQNLPTQEIVGIMVGESKEKVVEQTEKKCMLLLGIWVTKVLWVGTMSSRKIHL